MSNKKKKLEKNKKVNKNKKKHKPKDNNKKILQNSIINNMFPDAQFTVNDTDNKLSGVILDYAQPLLDKLPGFSEQKKIISLACLTWNMCIVPPKEAEKAKKQMEEKLCKGDKQAIEDMNELMGYLIARKYQLFEDDKRIIVSYKLTKKNNRLNLDVAYSQKVIE